MGEAEQELAEAWSAATRRLPTFNSDHGVSWPNREAGGGGMGLSRWALTAPLSPEVFLVSRSYQEASLRDIAKKMENDRVGVPTDDFRLAMSRPLCPL